MAGQVIDKDTGKPLAAAVVSVRGTGIGTWADEIGGFRIEGLAAGKYTLECNRIGYETANVQVVVEIAGVADIEIALAEEAIKLSAIRVTPSRFAIMGDDPHAHQALTEEEI